MELPGSKGHKIAGRGSQDQLDFILVHFASNMPGTLCHCHPRPVTSFNAQPINMKHGHIHISLAGSYHLAGRINRVDIRALHKHGNAIQLCSMKRQQIAGKLKNGKSNLISIMGSDKRLDRNMRRLIPILHVQLAKNDSDCRRRNTAIFSSVLFLIFTAKITKRTFLSFKRSLDSCRAFHLNIQTQV